MARLTPGEALGRAAEELHEARRLLLALEGACLQPASGELRAPLTALQQIDLLSQMLEELRRYLSGLGRAMPPDPHPLDLSEALQDVRLEAMRHRLGGTTPRADGSGGRVDLF